MICTECGKQFVPNHDEEDVCEECQLDYIFNEDQPDIN